MYTKDFLKKALIRALHTVWEALAAMIPAGVVITREMIVNANWKHLALTIVGWLATALLAGLTSFLKSMAVGMPEAEKPPGTEGSVTVWSYEDYYEGNPVGEPLHEHEEDE